MQLAAAVAVVKMEPVAQLLLAASLVLVEKEIIKVVAPQQVVAVLRQRLRQRILRQSQKHAYLASVWETQDITQRAVIITAMMDHLDALVQIHTNVEAAPQVDTHNFFSFSFSLASY
jgi:phosphopantetheinyl transferase